MQIAQISQFSIIFSFKGALKAYMLSTQNKFYNQTVARSVLPRHFQEDLILFGRICQTGNHKTVFSIENLPNTYSTYPENQRNATAHWYNYFNSWEPLWPILWIEGERVRDHVSCGCPANARISSSFPYQRRNWTANRKRKWTCEQGVWKFRERKLVSSNSISLIGTKLGLLPRFATMNLKKGG